jgi:uncharacterized protein
VRRKFSDAEIHHAYYGKEPPPVNGRDVVMVDFSYPRDVLEMLIADANSLLILDHHKTAAAALAGLPKPRASWNDHIAYLGAPGCESYGALFDMERSGAGLAWDYFFPDEARPWLVDYVEDRDLWRHRLPDSQAINAYIGILPFEFTAWSVVDAETTTARAGELGFTVRAKVHQYVAEASKNLRWATVAGYHVPVVNAPQVDISELLDAVIEQSRRENHPPCDFAVGWWQRFDGLFQYSLRSRGDFDVSEIAKTFGGGGHRNAAGFQSTTLVHA